MEFDVFPGNKQQYQKDYYDRTYQYMPDYSQNLRYSCKR